MIFVPTGVPLYCSIHNQCDHIRVRYIGQFMYASAQQACFTEFLGAQESKSLAYLRLIDSEREEIKLYSL